MSPRAGPRHLKVITTHPSLTLTHVLCFRNKFCDQLLFSWFKNIICRLFNFIRLLLWNNRKVLLSGQYLSSSILELVIDDLNYSFDSKENLKEVENLSKKLGFVDDRDIRYVRFN